MTWKHLPRHWPFARGIHQSSHYSDVMMGTMASPITSFTIVYWTVYSGADQRKHQSSVSLTFVPGIHRWPVNSPHKWPVTRKMFPFDDVIMCRSPHKGPITGSIDISSDVNKVLTEQSKCRWSETLWRLRISCGAILMPSYITPNTPSISQMPHAS